MFKSILSEKGNTLLLVLGTIIVVSLLMLPLIHQMNAGLLQSHTNAKYEQASEQAESGVRIWRKLIKLAADPMNSSVENRMLVEDLKRQMEQKQLIAHSSYAIFPPAGEPNKIEVTSSSGTGRVLRTKKSELIILRFPKSTGGGGTGPTQGSTGNEFYYQYGVATHLPTSTNPQINDRLSSIFNNTNPDTQVSCPAPYTVPKMTTSYDPAAFHSEFLSYTSYYLGSNFDNRMSARLPPHTVTIDSSILLSPVPIPSKVTSILTTSGDNWALNSSSSAVTLGGHVNLPSQWGTDLTIKGHLKAGGNIESGMRSGKMLFQGDVLSKGSIHLNHSSYYSDELVIEGDIIASGDIRFQNISSKVTIKGNVIAGGNISMPNGSELIVEGGMSAEGSIQLTVPRIQIKGNLISGGALTLANVNHSLTVEGDMHSGGNITLNGVSKVTIQGSFISKETILIQNGLHNGLDVNRSLIGKNIHFDSTSNGRVSIGQWTGNERVNGDSSSILAQNTLQFSSSTNPIRVTGDISANAYPTRFNPKSLWIGGSFISGGNLSLFQMNPWNITGSLHVNGVLSVSSTIDSFNVGQSLYTTGGLILSTAMGGATGSFRIGGSLLSGGPVQTTGTGVTMYNIRIDGDVVVKSQFSLLGGATTMTIGGSLITSGDITFGNSSSSLTIGGDMMTNGNMNYQAITSGFQVAGLMGALNHVNFNNHTNNQLVQFGGYYSGGMTHFQYPYSIGNFCIAPHLPDSGGGGSYEIEFGN